jgi:hypothetical protein
MADVLKILLLILGGYLIFISHWLISHALFPTAVKRARELYSHPVRLTLIGLAAAIPFAILGFALSKAGKGAFIQLLVFTTISVPMLFGLFGSAGLAFRIGDGLPGSEDQPEWRGTLKGALLLPLLYLLPFVGWFVISGWTLVSGLGATILILFMKPDTIATEAAESSTTATTRPESESSAA